MNHITASRFSRIPPVCWGEADPLKRGPLICLNRNGAPSNCIGNYGGQYGLYRAVADAIGKIDSNFIPDYSDTVSPIRISQNSYWSGSNAIVSFDPFGHLVPELFNDFISDGYNLRPTVVFTKAKLIIPEIHRAMAKGWLCVDDKILESNGRINVTKIAIEPVWYLSGMARRYGIDEETFREGLYYGMGGGHHALLNKDFNVYLPPFGETTVYIIGDLSKLGNRNVIHAARTHDKCGSSDTHGANICSCRPALMWGYEEGVRTAQQGGIGIIVYTEAEGRGHGVVIKNGVYNARQAGQDLPEDYFHATEKVAGLADLRSQTLTTDVYQWLGVTKINIWLSGSPEKTAAMKAAGIDIVEMRPLPANRLDFDIAVTEYDAKRNYGGYFYEPRTALNNLIS